ncbi:uncharacterized protein [Ptychodera flava]|uniref:uncharacterized protein isoform X2 n=1 Tax=Ptychodera flava TaxID=63121 RepID=UPI003969F8CA
MKWFVALALLFFSHPIAGSLFTNGVKYNDLYHRRVPLHHDELKSVLGSPLQSQRLLAMMTGRVHVPVARAMMSRYVNQYGFGTFLRPAIQNVRSRRDLALSMIMFLHMAKTVGNTIIDRLQEEADSRIYTFADEAFSNSSWFYVDEQDHELKGFFTDVVLEVCKEANKKCVMQDVPYNMCLRTDPSSDLEAAGVGLLAGYFDGCAFTKTIELVHTVKLSDKFMNYGGESRFFVPVGNPGNFDPNDISGKTIGFMKGWYSTRRCLVANNVDGAQALTFNRMHLWTSSPIFLVVLMKTSLMHCLCSSSWNFSQKRVVLKRQLCMAAHRLDWNQ